MGDSRIPYGCLLECVRCLWGICGIQVVSQKASRSSRLTQLTPWLRCSGGGSLPSFSPSLLSSFIPSLPPSLSHSFPFLPFPPSLPSLPYLLPSLSPFLPSFPHFPPFLPSLPPYLHHFLHSFIPSLHFLPFTSFPPFFTPSLDNEKVKSYLLL